MNSKTGRSASGGGNIRKRPDGRWEARYTLGFDPKTGKQKQKSVYGKTQKEVRQKLTKILSEIDEGTYVEPNRTKLGVWLDEWLRDYNGNLGHATASFTLSTYAHATMGMKRESAQRMDAYIQSIRPAG